MDKDKQKLATRAALITIISDVNLVIFKLIAGIVGRSTAMIADALHSLSDLYTTIIVIVGIRLAGRKADRNHPFGHERFECVAAILLSAVLFATGIGIGWTGLSRILSGEFDDGTIPGLIALIAAVTTIILKGIFYFYKRAVARKIESGAMMADAIHHLTDSLSSIASFAGIFFARMGFPILDPIAALVICLFIFKAAVDIFRDAIGKMTDRSACEETQEKMRNVIQSIASVDEIDALRTRLFGDKIFVEVEILVDGAMLLFEAHEIAENVHDAIEDAFPAVKHCMVHVNPSGVKT